MELNEPSGSGSGSHAEPSRLGAPVAHAPPDAARLPGAGRVEELEEDVQAVSTGQEIELRLQMDGGGRGKGRGVAAAAAAAAATGIYTLHRLSGRLWSKWLWHRRQRVLVLSQNLHGNVDFAIPPRPTPQLLKEEAGATPLRRQRLGRVGAELSHRRGPWRAVAPASSQILRDHFRRRAYVCAPACPTPQVSSDRCNCRPAETD